MYTIETEPGFLRALKRLVRRNPALRGEVEQKLKQVESDPFDPQLHMHSLSGKLTGRWAIRLTYSLRIVLRIDTTRQIVSLLDVGEHDDVYG